MSPLNWGETNRALRESKGRRTTGRRFQVKDGDTVPTRFLVNENEPYIYKRHYDNKSSRYFVCAEDAAIQGKHDGCVPCYEAKRQGKGGSVRNAARVFAFSVFDPRKFHVFDEEVDGPNGKSKFQPCKDDPTCKFCRRGNESKPQGVCHWSLSGTVTEQLQTFERDLLGQKCANCQIGTIKVKAYVCPTCEEPLDVDDPNDEYRCFECGKGPKNIVMVKPRELVVCSKGCKNARRTSLADAWVLVTRSGEGTNTTYNFSPGEVTDVPDGAEPLDLANNPEFHPIPAPEQSAVMGVPNPFKVKSRHAEEDDEEEVPFKHSPEDVANVFRRK